MCLPTSERPIAVEAPLKCSKTTVWLGRLTNSARASALLEIKLSFIEHVETKLSNTGILREITTLGRLS